MKQFKVAVLLFLYNFESSILFLAWIENNLNGSEFANVRVL